MSPRCQPNVPIATQPIGDLNVDKLIHLMVGRDLSEKFPKEIAPRGEEILRVERLTQGEKLKDISFSAYAGEVLGIAGLVGAGRTDQARAVFGFWRLNFRTIQHPCLLFPG
jgi:ribose transport system ATP-binding protein